MTEQETFILRVLACFALFSDLDANDGLMWRFDDGKPVFLVNCSDVFYWACADAQEITPENLHILELAIRDCKAVDEVHEAPHLFCARVRQMRPQRPVLETIDAKVLPLFLAAGPERDLKDEG